MAYKVGLLALVALLVTATMIVVFGLRRDVFKEMYEVKAILPNAGGVGRGTPVLLGGVQIGAVKQVLPPVENHVELILSIEKVFTLYEGQPLKVVSLGLIGDKYLEFQFIQTSKENEAVPVQKDGSGVLYGKYAMSINDLSEGLEELRSSITGVIKDVRERYTANEDFEGKLKKLLSSIDEVATKATVFFGEATKTVGSITDTVKDVQDSTKEISKTAVDLRGNFADVSKNFSDAVANLKENSKELQATLKNISSATGKLKDGNGTLGRLIKDPSFYEKGIEALDNINAATKRLQELAEYLKEHPSSLFWGRKKEKGSGQDEVMKRRRP
jgi:phospholipid/cholesterol/gamma-HCH transport system substrate-binding protein